jgi:hypothetical protein
VIRLPQDAGIGGRAAFFYLFDHSASPDRSCPAQGRAVEKLKRNVVFPLIAADREIRARDLGFPVRAKPAAALTVMQTLVAAAPFGQGGNDVAGLHQC